MKKPSLLKNERLARLMTSLLLCMGVLLPLMMSFGAGSALWQAVLTACISLAVFWLAGSGKRGGLVLGILCVVLGVVQFALPGFGFFGRSFEAFKALALYMNEVPGATVLYAGDIALLFGIAAASLSYAFSARNAGFLPAAVVVVLTLFGVWSLGEARYLWMTAPALISLLLLVSQTSHEKINLFEVLPLAAIVVAAAMLILPAGQTAIKPLHEAAMKLKQTISDYLFFTEPRNVFTLGTYGYYPMGSNKLGGAVSPSDAPVMTVKTDRKALLRAVAKDDYTGRSWRDTSNARRYLYVSPRWSALRESVFLENMPLGSIRTSSSLMDQYAVTVQMQNTATSTLFTPAFMRRLSTQSDMVAYFNEASELFITRDLQRGDRYTVYAPLFTGGDSALGALVQSAPKGSDAYYQQALQRYTSLPDHLEDKVFEDLRGIVANAATPYDKACAIQRHLQRYYRYTLEPETPPENQDFVTYFLYVGKEGYCTYYASAMTVLCRMAGLPARYVEGFIADPDADGFAYVTGADAHAWTEVYFEGFGWVPFDATPSQDEQDDPPPPDEPEPTPTPTPPPPEEEQQDETTPTPPPPEEDDASEPDDPEDPEDKPPFPWWILLVLLAAAAIVLRVLWCMPDRAAARAQGELDRVFIYGNAAYAVIMLRRRGMRPGETPISFARKLDRQKAFPAAILPLWQVMAYSSYSAAQPGPEQTALARDTFRQLYRRQRFFVKLRFMVWAAFGRSLYSCLDTEMKREKPAALYRFNIPAGKDQKKPPADAYRRKPSGKDTEEH